MISTSFAGTESKHGKRTGDHLSLSTVFQSDGQLFVNQ